MDATILIVGLVFVGLIAAVVYLIRDEKPKPPKKKASGPEATQGKTDVDPIKHLHRKLAQSEEKLKNLELNFEAGQLELAQTKDREKNLLKSKSEDVFDRGQYEKFKKEFQSLKKETSEKEEALEKEIALRRQQSSQLLSAQEERDNLIKRVAMAEDAHRKALATHEALAKELNDLKKKVQEQGRIVQEHAVQKTDGEWISVVTSQRSSIESARHEMAPPVLLQQVAFGHSHPRGHRHLRIGEFESTKSLRVVELLVAVA